VPVRGTDLHFTDLFDKRSGARVVLDWASLRALHLSDGEPHRVDVGVEMPVFTYPHEYTEWTPRMPSGSRPAVGHRTNVESSAPVTVSQMRAAPSMEAVTRVVPSGAKASAVTPARWPVSSCRRAPVAAS
jgi:hypothetical protein